MHCKIEDHLFHSEGIDCLFLFIQVLSPGRSTTRTLQNSCSKQLRRPSVGRPPAWQIGSVAGSITTIAAGMKARPPSGVIE